MSKLICKEKGFSISWRGVAEIIGINITEDELSKFGRPVRVVYHTLEDYSGKQAVRRSEVRYL